MSSSIFYSPMPFSVMAKPVGALCNLNCTYCYYLEKMKLYQHQNNFKMDEPLLEKFIKQYIQSQPTNTLHFVWQGGEPTLRGLDFFRKVIQLQQQYAGKKKIENALQTNGTLLNDEWCKFFKTNHFLIGISIDGPEHIHNNYRVFHAGSKPTFEEVMRGIRLLKKYQVDFNTLSVVHKENAKYGVEIYNFLKEIGSRFMQFIPIVERIANNATHDELKLVSNDYEGETKMAEWSVIPQEYAEFLIHIFNEWVKTDVGKYFVQIFDVALANWVGQNPGLCIFQETCGNALVIEHNGNIYNCDHFVYPEYLLGNIEHTEIMDMAYSTKALVFGVDKKKKLSKQCQQCEYLFACHGECPKHRFVENQDGEKHNYLCAAYQLFFKHIAPYMEFMKNELHYHRPPANVMQWVKKGMPQ